MLHKSVMVKEVIDALQVKGRKLFVDGTLGLGGYTEELLNQADSSTRIIAFELDADNLNFAKKRLASYKDRVIYVQENFAQLEPTLLKLNLKEIDGLMLDLGLSSPQVDDAYKGFSFLKEGPLDMRFDKNQSLRAEDIVMNYSEKKLADIFKNYGEERYAKRIAKAIVDERKKRKFTTTLELANFIESILPKLGSKQKKNIHSATRVFQALRIEVNQELFNLSTVLAQALEVLKVGGRFAVVSYHSLEDRIVKVFFKEQSKSFVNLPNELTTRILKPRLKVITSKPLTPSQEELLINPRARSARLRVAEKIS